MNQQNPYIPKPPALQTVTDFMALDYDFGVALEPANASFHVSGAHRLCGLIFKCLLEDWCNANGLNVLPRRNALGRFEAGIVKVSPITGQPRLLCSFTHESEGEAAFRAVLLYEQKKAAGEFAMTLEADQPKGAILDENGQALRARHAGLNGEGTERKLPGE